MNKVYKNLFLTSLAHSCVCVCVMCVCVCVCVYVCVCVCVVFGDGCVSSQRVRTRACVFLRCVWFSQVCACAHR